MSRKRPSYIPETNSQVFYHFETIQDNTSSILDVFFFFMNNSARYNKIKARFRQLALVVHPDKFTDDVAECRQDGKSMRVLKSYANSGRGSKL